VREARGLAEGAKRELPTAIACGHQVVNQPASVGYNIRDPPLARVGMRENLTRLLTWRDRIACWASGLNQPDSTSHNFTDPPGMLEDFTKWGVLSSFHTASAANSGLRLNTRGRRLSQQPARTMLLPKR
jgi:hypothetical protein